MAIGSDRSGGLQLDQLLQAIARQLGNQLPGAAAIESRGQLARHHGVRAGFVWLRWSSNQGNGPAHPGTSTSTTPGWKYREIDVGQPRQPFSRALWIQLSDLASTSRSLQRNALAKGLLGMRKENAPHREAHAPLPYLRWLQPAPSHSKGAPSVSKDVRSV